jgi:hypothetical protein
MKKALGLLCLFGPFYGYAQVADDKQQELLGQGRLNVGVSVGGGSGGYVGNSGHIAPRLQYFLTDGWSVNLEGRYDNNSGSQTAFYGGGLSTRYYFLRARRIALFGQAGLIYGQQRYYVDATGFSKRGSGTPVTDNTLQTNAGLGLHYRIGRRWSLEGDANRVLTNSSRSVVDASPWRVNVGVNFRLK